MTDAELSTVPSSATTETSTPKRSSEEYALKRYQNFTADGLEAKECPVDTLFPSASADPRKSSPTYQEPVVAHILCALPTFMVETWAAAFPE